LEVIIVDILVAVLWFVAFIACLAILVLSGIFSVGAILGGIAYLKDRISAKFVADS
jgi:hypothetical protein